MQIIAHDGSLLLAKKVDTRTDMVQANEPTAFFPRTKLPDQLAVTKLKVHKIITQCSGENRPN
jgi:hypothetical protein